MSSSQLKLRDVSDVTEDTGLDGVAGYVSQTVLQLRAVLLATLIVRGVALPHLLRQTVDGLEGVGISEHSRVSHNHPAGKRMGGSALGPQLQYCLQVLWNGNFAAQFMTEVNDFKEVSALGTLRPLVAIERVNSSSSFFAETNR